MGLAAPARRALRHANLRHHDGEGARSPVPEGFPARWGEPMLKEISRDQRRGTQPQAHRAIARQSTEVKWTLGEGKSRGKVATERNGAAAARGFAASAWLSDTGLGAPADKANAHEAGEIVMRLAEHHPRFHRESRQRHRAGRGGERAQQRDPTSSDFMPLLQPRGDSMTRTPAGTATARNRPEVFSSKEQARLLRARLVDPLRPIYPLDDEGSVMRKYPAVAKTSR